MDRKGNLGGILSTRRSYSGMVDIRIRVCGDGLVYVVSTAENW